MHRWGMVAVHVVLYLALLGLVVSGVITSVQSGLIDVIRGGSDGDIPNISGFMARDAHGALARIYIGLLVAHIGGVIVHQVRHGHVLLRMGIGMSAQDGVDSEVSSASRD